MISSPSTGKAHLVKGRVATFIVSGGLGLSAAISQIVLMRETVVLFNGNELSLGVFLGAWLLWTAVGSGLCSKLAPGGRHLRAMIVMVQCGSGLGLVATIWALRAARAHLQTVPGELLGPMETAMVSLVSLSGLCVLYGCLFPLTAELYRESCEGGERNGLRYAYLFETAGSAVGGVLIGLVLLPFFGSFQIGFLVLLLNVCLAWALIARGRIEVFGFTTTSLALASMAIAWVAPRLDADTQQRLWPGFRLIEWRDSVYGRLSVLSVGGLSSIYDNGSAMASVPDPATAEETVHYALLEHGSPRRVLLIGGGMNGSIAEVLKHRTVQRIDYVELDPALIELYRRLLPGPAASLNDSRVQVHRLDARFYLKVSEDHFDVIDLAVPEPENAQLNRFYTEEFFRIAREHLSPGGLLALQLRSSEDVISPERAAFLRCMVKTLGRVFPHVALIPGETMHLFAAEDAGALTEDPQQLIARLKERGLQTSYVREYFLPFRMAPDRMAQIHDLVRPIETTPTNRDFHPVAYYFDALLWNEQFRTRYAAVLKELAQVRFSALLAFTLAPALLFTLVWATRGRRRAREAAAWSVCASGYSAMTTQILLFLVFQSVYGYLYHELAFLIGMFMGGLAWGAWLGIATIRSVKGSRLRRLAACNQLLLASCGVLPLCVVSLLEHGLCMEWVPTLGRLALPAMAIMCGLPCGAQFSMSSAIYQAGHSQRPTSGSLYAFDLLGGSGGALVVAAFLIPIFGFWQAAWLNWAVGSVVALRMAVARSE